MAKNVFNNSTAWWVRYDSYEWVPAEDGTLYIKPTEGAFPHIYDPVRDSEQLVLDTVDTAVKCYKYRDNDAVLKNVIKEYVCKYGLLGIMTALPATVDFMEYDKIFLPKNIVIRDGVMDTEDYLDLFFPFGRPDLENDEDEDMVFLEQLFMTAPYEVQMEIMPHYSERFEWLKKLFRDWAFIIGTVTLVREEGDSLDLQTLVELQDGLSAFKGNAPTYHFYLADGPVIKWNYNSLLLMVQFMFSSMLADDKCPIRFCKRCGRPFVVKNRDMKYCSKECRANH